MMVFFSIKIKVKSSLEFKNKLFYGTIMIE